MKIIKADEEISKILDIREAEDIVYMKNMRFVDDTPFLYAEYYMNKSLLSGIEKILPTATSISKIYKDIYNLKPKRDKSEIDITSTNYISKQIFNIQNDLPIIKISTKTIDKNSNKTIDYCYSYFRSDMAKIIVDYKENIA